MRRIATLITSIFLFLTLTACNTGTTPSSTLGSDTPQSQTSRVMQNDEGGDDSFVNDQLIAAAAMGNGYSTADGYYEISKVFDGSASIVYTDYASARQIFLCNRPECRHDNESCNSYITIFDGFSPMIGVAGNKLLLTYPIANRNTPASILTCNMDGTDRKVLVELPANTDILMNMYSDGAMLYFDVSETQANGESKTKIMAVSLDGGASTTVYESDDWYTLTGTYGNNLVIDRMSANGEIVSLIMFDPSAANSQQEIASYVMNGSYARVYGGYLYSFDLTASSISKKALDGSYEKAIELPLDNDSYGHFTIVGEDTVILSLNGESSLVDFDTTTLQHLTLKNDFNGYDILPVAAYGDSFMVITGYEEIPSTWVNPEGDMEVGSSVEAIYAMISKADFAANRPNYTYIQSDIGK